MSIIQPKGKPSIAQQVEILESAIDTCKKIYNSQDCTGFGMFFTGIHLGKQFSQTLNFFKDGPVPIPKEAINSFFEVMGQNFIAQRNHLLMQQSNEQPGI